MYCLHHSSLDNDLFRSNLLLRKWNGVYLWTQCSTTVFINCTNTMPNVNKELSTIAFKILCRATSNGRFKRSHGTVLPDFQVNLNVN